jgi:hypothetical protein
MRTSRSLDLGQGGAAAETVRIFLLPPLLTLAVVACSLMAFTSYLARRSLQTTYVVSSIQQSGVCAICHDRAHAGVVRQTSLR